MKVEQTDIEETSVEQRLLDFNITLPEPADITHLPFASGIIVDNLVYLSGQTAHVEGKLKYSGTVGSAVTVNQAQEAAEACILNLIATLKKMTGDLNKVKRIVKLNGYVASEKDFTDQPAVINAASVLLNKVFGVSNQHARAAIGVAALPGGTPVEIDLVVELHK